MHGLATIAVLAGLAIAAPCLLLVTVIAARRAFRRVQLHRRVDALLGPGPFERAVWLRASF